MVLARQGFASRIFVHCIGRKVLSATHAAKKLDYESKTIQIRLSWLMSPHRIWWTKASWAVAIHVQSICSALRLSDNWKMVNGHLKASPCIHRKGEQDQGLYQAIGICWYKRFCRRIRPEIYLLKNDQRAFMISTDHLVWMNFAFWPSPAFSSNAIFVICKTKTQSIRRNASALRGTRHIFRWTELSGPYPPSDFAAYCCNLVQQSAI